MKRLTAGAIALALLGAGGAAQDAPRFRWDREGLASLRDAAAAARPAGKRLLLGLSGSPT